MKPSRVRPKIRRLVLTIGLTGAALAQAAADAGLVGLLDARRPDSANQIGRAHV